MRNLFNCNSANVDTTVDWIVTLAHVSNNLFSTYSIIKLCDTDVLTMPDDSTFVSTQLII